jgi:(p)ppGpp synthase/HD superfamily hydrolase
MILSPDFVEALTQAAHLHRKQYRKGTSIPYISHLMAVASIVLEHGGTEVEVIAALLHDAVEDQGGEPILEWIRRRFGSAVADIVDGCTDTYIEPKPEWRKRKEDYLAHLRHPNTSASIRLVSAADKLHNARTILSDYRRIGEALWTRFNGGRDGTLWYYRSVVDALRVNGETRLIRELDEVVTQLQTCANARLSI